MPIAVLRAFAAEIAKELGLREVGRLIGRGREQVRKFASGEILKPQERTRQRLGELYLERQRALEAQGAEAGAEGTAPAHDAPAARPAPRVQERQVAAATPMPLKLILPQPLEKATGEIRALFALIRQHPDAPETAVAVEQWLLRQVKREYAAEASYGRDRRRKKGEGGS